MKLCSTTSINGYVECCINTIRISGRGNAVVLESTNTSNITSLRNKYDVIVVVTSSYGEGDPPENFGGFFLALLAAAEEEDKAIREA